MLENIVYWRDLLFYSSSAKKAPATTVFMSTHTLCFKQVHIMILLISRFDHNLNNVLTLPINEILRDVEYIIK